MACFTFIPRRYCVALMNTLMFVIAIGFRTTFAIIMTHVSQVNGSAPVANIFPNCSTHGTDRDFQVSWSGEQVSFTHTIYFFGSLLTQIPAGMVAIWISPRRVVTMSVFSTSVLYLVLTVAIRGSYGLVLFIRFVQGLLEGGILPGAYGVLALWAPKKERSRFMSITGCGHYFSPVVSMVSVGALACYVQWNAGLYLYGGVGMVLAIAYDCLLYDRPLDHPNLGSDEIELYRREKTNTKSKPKLKSIPWKKILTSMPMYAVVVGAFLRNYVFSLMITEEPEYFKDAFGMNTATIGMLSALPHLSMGTMALLSGFIIDYIKHKKWANSTNARKIAQTIGSSGDVICFVGLYFVEGHQWKAALILMCVGFGLGGFVVSGYQANQLELAPQYAPLITAFSRLGIIGSVISTAVAGAVAGDTHNIKDWQIVFLITGIVNVVGIVFYDIFAYGDTLPWVTEDTTALKDDSTLQSNDITHNKYESLSKI